MSLARCRECRAKVSEYARTCPHCGVSFQDLPKATSKDWGLPGCLLIIVFPFALVMLAGLLSDRPNAQNYRVSQPRQIQGKQQNSIAISPSQLLSRLESIGLQVDGEPWSKSRTFDYWTVQLRIWNNGNGFATSGTDPSGNLNNEVVVTVTGPSVDAISEVQVEAEIHDFKTADQVRSTRHKAAQALKQIDPSIPAEVKAAVNKSQDLKFGKWSLKHDGQDFAVILRNDHPLRKTSPNNYKPRKAAPDKYKPDTGEAFVMSQRFVTRRLKSPSTAKFDYISETVYLGNNLYRVNAWVDAQNAFGAMLRTDYVAFMRDNRNNTWSCPLVALEGEDTFHHWKYATTLALPIPDAKPDPVPSKWDRWRAAFKKTISELGGNPRTISRLEFAKRMKQEFPDAEILSGGVLKWDDLYFIPSTPHGKMSRNGL